MTTACLGKWTILDRYLGRMFFWLIHKHRQWGVEWIGSQVRKMKTAASSGSLTRWAVMVEVKSVQSAVLDDCCYLSSALETFCSEDHMIILYLFIRDLNFSFSKKKYLHTFLGFRTFVYMTSKINILSNYAKYLWSNIWLRLV